jgi:hypothetical protein
MILEIILLVIAAAGLTEGARLSKSTLLFVDPVGPGWYLFFMSCLLFICATALLVRQFIRRKAGHREVNLFASALFFIVVQRIFGERSWPRCAMIGVSITACFYFVFSYLAGMPLP